MKRNLISICIMLGGIFFLSATCTATPVTGFVSEITGSDMVGMSITVKYNDDKTHISTWQNLTDGDYADYSGVVSPSWGSLLFKDVTNTFGFASLGTWDLSVKEGITINSLTIDGGKTVFDIILGDGDQPDWGTTGSKLGHWEGLDPGDLSNPLPAGTSTINNVTFDWTFSDIVYLAGTSPSDVIGDVYNTMRFDFRPNGGLTTEMHYKLDTDLVNPVPEPSTILLFGTGLVGVSALARRKKYNQQ